MDGRASKDFVTLAPRAASMYRDGKSLAQIAERLGKGVATISRWLDQLGVEKRDAGAGTRGKAWSAARRAHSPAKAVKRVVVEGKELRGPEILSHRAIGNRSTRSNGYISVHLGRGKRQYEHILVAQRALGRDLRPGEVVHHINGVKTDNRPENLLVCTHTYHLALHARMRRDPYWQQVEALAREIR